MTSLVQRCSSYLGAILGGAILLSACGAGGAGASGPISANLMDTAIKLDRTTASAGDVTFTITNASTGAKQHEMVVVRTDLPADQLPRNAEGRIDEEKLTSSGEQGDIEPGKTVDLKLKLTPGRYLLFCNLPSHYDAGMHTELTITP